MEFNDAKNSAWVGRTGGCQCAAIRYRFESEPLTLYACHCRHCQKQSASAFGMSLWLPLTSITFTAGSPVTWDSRGDSGNLKRCAFCSQCGTRIYHEFGDGSDTVSLKPGTLDDTGDLAPVAHIWTRSAQAWLNMEDSGVPCYPEAPDDEEELIRCWQRGFAGVGGTQSGSS